MRTISEILVAVDFGPAGDEAIAQATDLALAFGAHITLLHVYEAPIIEIAGVHFLPIEDIGRALEASALAGVAAVAAKIELRTPLVSGLVRQGSAWRNINEVAAEIRADLVVMGTHGRTGLPRTFIGSVAEQVIRTSKVPVLTVHASPPPA